MAALYIVTGANGHLGNTICKLLIKDKKHVRGLILPGGSAKMLLDLGVEVVFGDVTKVASLEPLFDMGKETFSEVYVIHTAGIVSIATKKTPILELVNVHGTAHMIEVSMKHQVDRFIYVSSVHAILERPHDEVISEASHFHPDLVHGAYAKTKAEATQLVLDATKKGLKGIVVHPSGIIGPNDYGKTNMTMMIEDYMNNKLTSRVEGAYDFVDVRDVAQGILGALNKGDVGACYILSGHHTELSHLFKLLKELSGKKRLIHVLPFWFAKLTIPLAELYYKLKKQSPIYSKYSLYTLKTNAHFSHDKATQTFNYQIRPLKETLKDTITWLDTQKRLHRLKILNFIRASK
ncbi:MAG: NAD-dependent epimerase/dehydratase family protein [Acholeplasmataceae bacterium]